MARPCEEGKPCIHEEFDYGEDEMVCAIDFDGTNCPYVKPWGKKKYIKDHQKTRGEDDDRV